MAPMSRLDKAIEKAQGEVERLRWEFDAAIKFRDALVEITGVDTTLAPKRRGRKPNGLPKTNGAEVNA